MQGQNLTFVDLLVAGTVLISTVFAVWRGFVRETLSILGWIAAVFAALYFGPYVAAFLRSRIATPFVGTLIAYAGIFIVVLAVLSFASFRLSERVRNSPVGAVDRVLGLAFGLVRGLALIAVAYLAFSIVVPPRAYPASLRQARLLPLIRASSQLLIALLPHQDGAAIAGESKSPQAPAHAQDAAARVPGQARKSYGAADRSALDRLIEATGNGAKP